jgi:transposase
VLPTPLSRQPSDIPWLLGVHDKGCRRQHAFNNAAERALRGFALGRKSWLFAGSERGADRAAAVTTLIMTAKLNDIDPLAWLADVLARIADLPQSRLPELLPWEWKALSQQQAA